VKSLALKLLSWSLSLALPFVLGLDFGKDKENPILRLRLSNKISKQVVFQRKDNLLIKKLLVMN
jgi:hypothetical protein